MKPFVLAVDLDGVCAAHTEAFRRVVAAEKSVPEESLPLIRSWDFVEWGFAEGEFERLHSIAVGEYRMFRDMDPIEGCAAALWRLSDAGVRIRIVTHRLYVNRSHRVAVSDTVSWLDAHEIPYRDICFLADKSVVDAAAYLEDAPHNIASIREAGGHAIVFDQPYNAHLEGPRAVDWVQAEEMVVELMTAQGDAVTRPLPGLDHSSGRLHGRIVTAAS